jgi:hypothetical protein
MRSSSRARLSGTFVPSAGTEDSTCHVHFRVTPELPGLPSVQKDRKRTLAGEKMAALNPGQLKTDADGTTSRSPGTPATPKPGRYEIDSSCSAVTFRTRHMFGLAPVRGSFAIRGGLAARYLDMTVEVRCVRN